MAGREGEATGIQALNGNPPTQTSLAYENGLHQTLQGKRERMGFGRPRPVLPRFSRFSWTTFTSA